MLLHVTSVEEQTHNSHQTEKTHSIKLQVKQFEIVIKLTPNDVDEEAFEDALEIKDDDQMRFKVLRAGHAIGF